MQHETNQGPPARVSVFKIHGVAHLVTRDIVAPQSVAIWHTRMLRVFSVLTRMQDHAILLVPSAQFRLHTEPRPEIRIFEQQPGS
jgi:hypothetical protein